MATNIFAYYNVTVRDAEDVFGDEPRLIMAFVTIGTNGTPGVQVDVLDSGELGSSLDNEDNVRGMVTSTNAPTVEAPFFAMVAIALDNDKSFDSHRRNHIRAFQNSVQQIFNTLNEQPRGIPRMDTSDTPLGISQANRVILNSIREATRTELQRHWLIRDKDDTIGAPSVNIFSNLGAEYPVSGIADDGHTFNYRKRFISIFGEDGHLYNVNFTLSANNL